MALLPCACSAWMSAASLLTPSMSYAATALERSTVPASCQYHVVFRLGTHREPEGAGSGGASGAVGGAGAGTGARSGAGFEPGAGLAPGPGFRAGFGLCEPRRFLRFVASDDLSAALAAQWSRVVLQR